MHLPCWPLRRPLPSNGFQQSSAKWEAWGRGRNGRGPVAGRRARHSTAFHAIAVVILLCFTVFHVELSARRLVDATALDLMCHGSRAMTRNMTRYYVRLVYQTKGDNE